MKRCPFCAEDIQDAAVVCKHCGRDLATGTRDGVAATALAEISAKLKEIQMRRFVVTVVVLLVVLVSMGCSASQILTGNTPISYSVTGTAKHVSVTYQNSSGGTTQTGAAVPFTYNYGTAKKGDFVYISAQIDTSPDPGSITVSILKNGSTSLFSANATGFANIATASGSVP